MAVHKKHKNKKRRMEILGAPPGTILVNAQSPKPIMQVIAFGPDAFTETAITDLDTIPQYLDKWSVTWINVDGLGDQQTIHTLRDMFNLHVLALEDVLSLHQRPKLERYDDHMFLVLQMLEPEPPVQTEQLSIFFGEKFVLTLQEHPGDCLDPIRERIRDGAGRVRTMAADYLAYCLMDAVVDAYFPRLDELSDKIEAIEDEVVAHPNPRTVNAIHAIKRDLIAMRRFMFPLRETVNAMIRDGGRPITETTRVYLRDCYDHVVHILDLLENYREIISGLLDIYLSSISNRMNEIMKVLTIISTLFIPLTFIVGIYGMNFDPDSSYWNMPELHARFGYPAVILIMIGIVVAQVYYFWRKGWLSSNRHRKDD